MKILASSEIEEICSLYLEKTYSTVKLSELYGVSHRTIRNHLKARNIEVIHRGKLKSLSQDELQKIVKAYQSGKPLNFLARQFGVSPKRIKGLLGESRIKVRSSAEALRKYFHDEDIFDVIEPI